MKLQLGCH